MQIIKFWSKILFHNASACIINKFYFYVFFKTQNYIKHNENIVLFHSSQIVNCQKNISTSSCPPPVPLHLGMRRCRRKWICLGGCHAWFHPPSLPPLPALCGTNTVHGKTVPHAPEVDDQHSVIQCWGKDPNYNLWQYNFTNFEASKVKFWH